MYLLLLGTIWRTHMINLELRNDCRDYVERLRASSFPTHFCSNTVKKILQKEDCTELWLDVRIFCNIWQRIWHAMWHKGPWGNHSPCVTKSINKFAKFILFFFPVRQNKNICLSSERCHFNNEYCGLSKEVYIAVCWMWKI